MVRRREIADARWEQIEPLLLENGRRGGRWRDHRTAADGNPLEATPRRATMSRQTDPRLVKGLCGDYSSTGSGTSSDGL